jgi:hypothetical protein
MTIETIANNDSTRRAQGMPSRQLERAVFEQRFKSGFIDPAFARRGPARRTAVRGGVAAQGAEAEITMM